MSKRNGMGPRQDPVRQQGRDPRMRYYSQDWYTTEQRCDRSRVVGVRRVYHRSYSAGDGITPDAMYESLSEIAREFEEAGIDLGWGNVRPGYQVRHEADLGPYHEAERRHQDHGPNWTAMMDDEPEPAEECA